MVQLRTLLDHKTISGGALWNSWEAEGRGGDTLTLAATLWATASGRSHSWKRGVSYLLTRSSFSSSDTTLSMLAQMGRHDLKRARQDELWDAATPSGSPLIDQPLPVSSSSRTSCYLSLTSFLRSFLLRLNDLEMLPLILETSSSRRRSSTLQLARLENSRGLFEMIVIR